MAIRKSKLPDPVLIGNAGSFLKMFLLVIKNLKEIKSEYSDIPFLILKMKKTEARLPFW